MWQPKKNLQLRVVYLSAGSAHAPHTHNERDVRKHSNCARLKAKELCRLLRRRSWICGGPSRLVGCLLHDVIVDAVDGGRFLFGRSARQGFLLLRRLGLPAKGKATALLGGHRRQIVLVLCTANGIRENDIKVLASACCTYNAFNASSLGILRL